MPRFAANLSLLFAERPLAERFAASRDAGFRHVELLFPYEMPASEIRARLDDTGQGLVLINTPAGDWQAGERGFAAVPGQRAAFQQGFARALDYAQALDVTHIHLMAGIANGPSAEEVFMRNLAWAAAQAPDQSLTIEPINPIDMPGYALASFDRAARILDWIGAPNLHLQFDAYHAHRITGDVQATWALHGHRAAHVQIAGCPGRHEPAVGEIDYPAFFDRLDADEYAGIVSAEYHPAGRTEDGLGWCRT